MLIKHTLTLPTGGELRLYSVGEKNYLSAKEVANALLYVAFSTNPASFTGKAVLNSGITVATLDGNSYSYGCKKYLPAEKLPDFLKELLLLLTKALSGSLGKREERIRRCKQLLVFAKEELQPFLTGKKESQSSLFYMGKPDFEKDCLTSAEHKANLSPRELRNRAIGKFGQDFVKKFFEGKNLTVECQPFGGKVDFFVKGGLNCFFVEVKTHKSVLRRGRECLLLSREECIKYDALRRAEKTRVIIFWVEYQSGEYFLRDIELLSRTIDLDGEKFPFEDMDGHKCFAKENFGKPLGTLSPDDLAQLKEITGGGEVKKAPTPFATKIQELMLFRGYSSLAEFAREIRFPASTLRSWIKGDSSVRPSNLENFARAVGVPVNWL